MASPSHQQEGLPLWQHKAQSPASMHHSSIHHSSPGGSSRHGSSPLHSPKQHLERSQNASGFLSSSPAQYQKLQQLAKEVHEGSSPRRQVLGDSTDYVSPAKDRDSLLLRFLAACAMKFPSLETAFRSAFEKPESQSLLLPEFAVFVHAELPGFAKDEGDVKRVFEILDSEKRGALRLADLLQKFRGSVLRSGAFGAIR